MEQLRKIMAFAGGMGITYLGLIQPVFAHGVSCGPTGCPVGAHGINDWHLIQTAFDNTFYFSFILYGIIAVLVWSSIRKRKSISLFARNEN